MAIFIDSEVKDCVVFSVVKKKDKFEVLGKELEGFLKEDIISELSFFNNFNEVGDICFFRFNERKVVCILLKEDYCVEDLRKGFSKVFKFLKSKKEREISIVIAEEVERVVLGVVEGLDLTDYKFDKYLSKKDDLVMNFGLMVSSKFEKLIYEKLVLGSNVKFVRDLVNANANEVTPEMLANSVQEFCSKNKLKCEVLDEKEINEKNMGLIRAVGQGSKNPPRLIIAEYNGDVNCKEKIALVGKGITFDTGGINLKPTNFVEDMKCDMGGAATVFGAFRSAVELGVKKNLVLVMCCAENAISGSSYLPGDVFKSYLGKSVEIKNTDAEGRLVLADGLEYVQDRFKVNRVVDVATLTGACMIALGKELIAIMGNDVNFENDIFDAGEVVNERGWRLPIYDEHRDLLKSKIADFSNLGGKFGGASSAGAFLEKFILEGVSWVHLDIAGAAYSTKEKDYFPEFGTGRGVRLIVEYLKNF